METLDSSPMMQEVEKALKPYRGVFPSRAALPAEGIGRDKILQEVEQLRSLEEDKWRQGYVSGAVYHGDREHIDFLNRVYGLHSQSNPLHPDIWPSTTKFEAEIVSMTAHMLHGDPEQGVCGTVSSGGTESILLAMKTYRDWARQTKGITSPELVIPVSAHAAFVKAGEYFGIQVHRIPVAGDFRADVKAMRAAVNDDTIALVGSAPPFPHGLVDPIEELSEIAREHEIGFHTDACLGGFILPWAEKLGYPVPAFDFRLPGVTSISADTHKFGYALKGTSVILYRDPELRHFQYFAITDWPGGLYNSPTFAGSRPGGLSAACWAAMVSMGESGYLEAARRILETASGITAGIRGIPELSVIGEPTFVIAFQSEALNIYQVLEFMTQRGWGLNGLHLPPSVHLCVTLRHTQPGVKEQFLEDLRAGVEHVKHNPEAPQGVGPIYGMAASSDMRGMVSEVLNWYMDMQYRV
jgi:sphinganine-1-phosphate aldolase